MCNCINVWLISYLLRAKWFGEPLNIGPCNVVINQTLIIMYNGSEQLAFNAEPMKIIEDACLMQTHQHQQPMHCH